MASPLRSRPPFSLAVIHYMKMKHWMLLRKLCLLYIAFILALVACELLVFGFVEYGSKPTDFVGCYGYDALLVGFECSGLPASELIAFALNYPLYHLYMPFFIVWNPALIFAAIAMYSPLVMLIVSNNKVESTRV